MSDGQTFSSASDCSRVHTQPQGTSASMHLRMQAPSSQLPWRRSSSMMRNAQLLQQHHRGSRSSHQQLRAPSSLLSAVIGNTDSSDKSTIPNISSTSRTMSSTVAPNSVPPIRGVTTAIPRIELAISSQQQARLLASHNKIHAASLMLGDRRRKSYVCGVCGKAFTGLSNLEAHERVHTGEKPFRCDTCGKSFSEAGNLKKHQRVHTGEKPFRCDQCGKRFAWICNLRTHQQSATGCGPQAIGGLDLG